MTDPTTAETEAETEIMTEDAPAPGQEKGWSPNPSRRRIVVAVGAILFGVLVALFAWGLPPFAGGDETTNNAYVRGRTTVVSPQVAGYLVEVPVADFQRVEKGELLARIDDAPYQQKLQQGAANTAAQQEVHLNLAYRWFCRLDLDGSVPDHSTFSKNRHGRFRDSDLLRKLFEMTVERCMREGLVGAEGFAVDASLIRADVHRQRSVPGEEGLPPEAAGRAVAEYLEVLDDAAFGGAI